MAGSIERRAKIIRTNTEFQETASPAVVSWYSVVPALMAIKEGGATPIKTNKQNQYKPSIACLLTLQYSAYINYLLRI